MYKEINTEEKYNKLLRSGLFWEFHQELSGNWNEDKIKILGNKEGCQNCDNSFLKSDPQRSEKICLRCYAVHNWEGRLIKN